jgi:hypothetical protein
MKDPAGAITPRGLAAAPFVAVALKQYLKGDSLKSMHRSASWHPV